MCLVDFKKAFDRVNWLKMMEVVILLKIEWIDRRMIKELYLGEDES